jgi:hypothetical protein
MYELVRDLIRVGIFAKESVDAYGFEDVIGFQCVG